MSAPGGFGGVGLCPPESLLSKPGGARDSPRRADLRRRSDPLRGQHIVMLRQCCGFAGPSMLGALNVHWMHRSIFSGGSMGSV